LGTEEVQHNQDLRFGDDSINYSSVENDRVQVEESDRNAKDDPTTKTMDGNDCTILTIENRNVGDDALNWVSTPTTEMEETKEDYEFLLDVVEDVQDGQIDDAGAITINSSSTVGTEEVQHHEDLRVVEKDGDDDSINCSTIDNKRNEVEESVGNAMEVEAEVVVDLSISAPPSKNDSDCSWKQRRHMYRKLGVQARRRHYQNGSPLAVAKKEGADDGKNDN